jgi:plastocyanin
MSAGFGPPLSINSPITQSGRVVVNAVKDAYSIYRRRHNAHPDGGDVSQDQFFHVLTHELAFRDLDRTYETRSTAYDNRLAVVTSWNGGKPQSADSDHDVAFVGVAATRALHDEASQHANEEDCVVQVGGLCTVLNNDDAQIAAGDWVAWDWPGGAVHTEGAPAAKRTFRVRSLNSLLSDFDGKDTADKELKLMLGNVLLANRVIGRAMSTARPGDQLDILLGSYC